MDRAMVMGHATLMRPVGCSRCLSSTSLPSRRVRSARRQVCRYSLPKSVRMSPRGLRCTSRTSSGSQAGSAHGLPWRLGDLIPRQQPSRCLHDRPQRRYEHHSGLVVPWKPFQSACPTFVLSSRTLTLPIINRVAHTQYHVPGEDDSLSLVPASLKANTPLQSA